MEERPKRNPFERTVNKEGQEDGGDYKKYREILKDLAESSSLHGVGKIASSRQWAVKLLWCTLLIAAMCLFGYQLSELVKTYYSYPIQTSVHLKHGPTKFPSITVCNMNPLRLSASKASEEFKTILTNQRKRRSVNDDDGMTNTINSATYPQKEHNHYGKGRHELFETKVKSVDKPVGVNIRPTTLTEVTPINARGVSDEGVANGNQADRKHTVTVSDVDDTLKYRYKRGLDNGSISSDDSDSDGGSNSGDSSSDTGTSSSGDSSSDTDTSSSGDSYSGTGGNKDGDSNTQTGDRISDGTYTGASGSSYDYSGTKTAYFNDQLFAKKDEWQEKKDIFQVQVKNVSRTKRMLLGHQKEHFIHSASFAGILQNISSDTTFTTMTTVEFGNCVTMESSKYVAFLSGPSKGIKLTLNIQVNDYITNFAEVQGVRLVVHESDTFPFAAEEGFSLGSASETNIALQLIDVQHLGQPYGECTDGQSFFQKYGYRYTKTACYQFCRIERIQDLCGCIPPTGPDIELNTTALPVCNPANTGTERECVLETELSFSRDCQCLKPCRQSIYEKTITTREWPNQDYLDNHLIPEVCERNDTSIAYECFQSQNNYYLDYDRVRTNFLKVAIYFEDLSYQTVTEEPFYTGVRFLSDVGGAMGLFMGASVLTYVELVQLGLETIFYLMRKHQPLAVRKTAVEPLE